MDGTLKWLCFNIVLALIPLALNFILVKLLVINISWYKILKDGELFVFSSAVSASAIGDTFFRHTGNISTVAKVSAASPTTQASIIGSASNEITMFALLIVLILSAFLFAISSLLKFQNQSPPDEKLFSCSSIACAALSTLLSYFAIVG